MARETPIEQTIPAIYKRTSLSLLMYGFVTGARAALHTITVANAIRMFMDEYGLTDDTYNFDSAMNTYFRIQRDIIELNKSETNGS